MVQCLDAVHLTKQSNCVIQICRAVSPEIRDLPDWVLSLPEDDIRAGFRNALLHLKIRRWTKSKVEVHLDECNCVFHTVLRARTDCYRLCNINRLSI
jgi:hypothetical protein